MPYPLASEMIQVLDEEGLLVAEPPSLTPEELRRFYRYMVLGRLFSDRMIALQRQGRMGTFAPIQGQEAAAGLATALAPDDWLIGTYRELLPYYVKGVPLTAGMATTKGHFGDGYPRTAHCLPIQIVLAAQMLHATGIAMAIKYDGKPQVVLGTCGDGATSEGDFNEALNFAGVFKAPLVAVVQNNGWAISVPRRKQSATEFIAHRGPAFGMPGYIVDGNDILAVHKVIGDCVARARAGDGPTLVELITYRLGAHTTADDPTRYQPEAELTAWRQRNPILRLRRYLRSQGLLDDDEQIHDEVTAEIQTAVEELEAMPPPDPNRVFDLVYETPTPQLEAQRRSLLGGNDA